MYFIVLLLSDDYMNDTNEALLEENRRLRDEIHSQKVNH